MSSMMKSFFEAPKASPKKQSATWTETDGPFAPFCPPADTVVAPITRAATVLTAAEYDARLAPMPDATPAGLLSLFVDQASADLVPRSAAGRHAMKLLQFHDSNKPTFYGTLAMQSSEVISGRRPHAKDTAQIDYDYESDDDWAELEPGEELLSEEEEEADGSSLPCLLSFFFVCLFSNLHPPPQSRTSPSITLVVASPHFRFLAFQTRMMGTTTTRGWYRTGTCRRRRA